MESSPHIMQKNKEGGFSMTEKERDLFAYVFEKFLYAPALRNEKIKADGLKIVWIDDVHKDPAAQQ